MEPSIESSTGRREAVASVAAAWLGLAALPAALPAAAQSTRKLADSIGPMPTLLDFLPNEQHASIQDGNATFDCAPAFVSAFAAGVRCLRLPAGRYAIGSTLVVPAQVCLVGDGYGVAPGQAATIIRKLGSFDGVVLQTASQLHNLSVEGGPGDQADGVFVLGGRGVLRDVSVFGHGRDGVKVGDRRSSAANTNLWRLENVISRSNKRHGLFIAHEGKGLQPDANAGIVVGFEASYNGGDGVRVGEAVDNQLLGLVIQSNGGMGLHLDRLARGNVALTPYTENNAGGDVVFEAGADRNFLLGFRSGINNTGIVNKGADNVVWGRRGSVSGVPLHESPEAFLDLQILETSSGGAWRFTKLPDSRHLHIELANTGKAADVLLQSEGKGSSGLRFSTDAGSAALRDVRTSGVVSVKLGRLAPQSSADVPVPLASVDASYVVQVMPMFAVPVGVSWNAYWDPASSSVKARFTNAGNEAVNVAGPCQVVAFKAS